METTDSQPLRAGIYRMLLVLVVIALAAILKPSANTVIFVLVVMGWAGGARLMRGEVLRIKEGEFVKLAVVAGAGTVRIMARHLLPNLFPLMTVTATLGLGGVLLGEAILSYLGLGVPPPHPSWGGMTADGRNLLVMC